MTERISQGIRASVQFTAPEICPIVEISKAAETTIDSVASNVCATEDTESVTEFSIEADTLPDCDITPIFSHDSTHRYRVTHSNGVDCPCECLGKHGCPVTRYVAKEGTLTLVFHTAGYEQLQVVVRELRDRFPDMEIKRFVRSPARDCSADSVLFDRSKLTARQVEVLETAYELGYFERPRRANATEVAKALDIDPTTFSEHLAAAQSKVFGDVLDE